MAAEVDRAGGLAYRRAEPAGEPADPPLLCVHGFPESSYMWSDLLARGAEAGHPGLAPDLIGFGDTPPDPPGTWERQIEALDRFVEALDPAPAVLVVHDWGGLIGLRWACERPERIAGQVISNTGFFPDGKWHGIAEIQRTPGEGERLVEGLERSSFGEMLRATTPAFTEEAIDEYWKAFTTPEGRAGTLELYRSGDFEKLAPYQGRLGALGVPSLLLWGENDPFAPLPGAYRFRKEIPHARLEVLEGAGHFVYTERPERCAELVLEFLRAEF